MEEWMYIFLQLRRLPTPMTPWVMVMLIRAVPDVVAAQMRGRSTVRSVLEVERPKILTCSGRGGGGERGRAGAGKKRARVPTVMG